MLATGSLSLWLGENIGTMVQKTKKVKLGIVLVAAATFAALIGWFLLDRFEGEKPAIVFELATPFISKSQDPTVSISDMKSGVRKLWISLVKDGKETTLLEELFPSSGLVATGEIHEKKISLRDDPEKLGLSDGDVILRMAVWDYSWRGWFNGNQTYIEKNLTIDTRAPEIEIYSKAHNVAQGGSGLAMYRISEPCPQSGVTVGNQFFPGYAGVFEDPNVHLAFFALTYKQGPGTDIFVSAADRAGNSTKAGLNYHIRRKVFKKDTIRISDKFLNWKVPEFKVNLPNASNVEKFLAINRDQRQADYNKIHELSKTPARVLYWSGRFLRLPKSAPRAGFADHRTYTYNGREIDRQVHLGADLASTKHSPVPAANGGAVVFADRLGIYGRTVFIDHGFGLFSMYAHLNQISVKDGQSINRGDILGKTGSTGLAGGDHLHFAILIQNTFVNPVEWWDATWIKHNISSKIDMAKSR
jgi:murein DD-endopeptidase MepM/ murein hydrolase activator NlpD